MRNAGFPDGLLEGIDHLHRILKKGPHAPEVGERKEKTSEWLLPLSYKLAQKFASKMVPG